MSILGVSKKLPQAAPTPFGLRQERANTNQQARPVPLLYGQQRLSVTFLSEVFDIIAAPVTQSVGKKSTQTGVNYFASLAALVCAGPIDALVDVFLNGQPVYSTEFPLYPAYISAAGNPGDIFYTVTFQTINPHGLSTGDTVIILGADQQEYDGEFPIKVVSATQFQYLIPPTGVLVPTANQTTGNISTGIYAQVRLDPVLRNGDNPDFATITLPDFGYMTIYWGTETQPQDSYLEDFFGDAHPAYLGCCYIVFRQLYFGFNQTNVPNIEVVVQRNPLPSWGTQSATLNDEANPAYVMADLLQNPRTGLMMLDGDIDTTGIDAAAAVFATEGMGVSSAIVRSQDVRTLLMTLCETVDALPVLNLRDVFTPSLMVLRPPGDLGALPMLDDSYLADLPTFTPADWSSCYAVTTVTFQNRDLGFTDDARSWRDNGLLNVARNPDILQLDRRWITNADLAQAMANAAGQAAAIPSISGRAKLVWDLDAYVGLSPGSAFQLSYSRYGMGAVGNFVFRVTSRSIPVPEKPEFEIEFEADKTYLYSAIIGGPHVTPAELVESNPAPTPPLAPLPAPDDRLMLFELPPGLCPGIPAIAALVARGSTAMTGFAVWVDKNRIWNGGAAPESYFQAATGTLFAFHGALLADYPANTRTIDLEVGAQVLLDGPDTALDAITAFEALANTMLAFIDNEILSLADWTLAAPGLYSLKFIRGRFGTPKCKHLSGAQVMMISRGDMVIVADENFQPDNAIKVKIQPQNQDLSSLDALTLTLAGTAWRIPAPVALAVNGNTVNAVFPGGMTPIVVTWGLPDAGGLLPRFDLVKRYTRLKVYIGITADSTEVTADSTLVTADGGLITPETGELFLQVDIEWPTQTYSFELSQNFCITAETVTEMGWKQIVSADKTILNALKYP